MSDPAAKPNDGGKRTLEPRHRGLGFSGGRRTGQDWRQSSQGARLMLAAIVQRASVSETEVQVDGRFARLARCRRADKGGCLRKTRRRAHGALLLRADEGVILRVD